VAQFAYIFKVSRFLELFLKNENQVSTQNLQDTYQIVSVPILGTGKGYSVYTFVTPERKPFLQTVDSYSGKLVLCWLIDANDTTCV
jgi:hypothetical protein